MPISDRLDGALSHLRLDGVPFDDFVETITTGGRTWFQAEFSQDIRDDSLTPQGWQTKVMAGPGEARTLWGGISTAPFPAGDIHSPSGMHWTSNPS